MPRSTTVSTEKNLREWTDKPENKKSGMRDYDVQKASEARDSDELEKFVADLNKGLK